jgi:hypothetical protein
MPYKPWIIICLSLIYFLSPPVILISASYISLIPLTGPSGILTRLTPGDISALLTYYLITICLLSIRNWGWWIFILSSLYLIAYNVRGYLLNPFYTPLSLLIYTLVLTTAASLLFRKELIAPYFNPRLRWWETDKRFELSFQCRLKWGEETITIPVTDISRGGCFLATGRSVPLGKTLTLEISINRLYLSLKGEVVRNSETPVKGWGILFKDISMIESRGLKELIHLLKFYHGDKKEEEKQRKNRRYTNPYYVYLDGPAIKGEGRIHGIMENFSRSGICLVIDNGTTLTENRNMTLELPRSFHTKEGRGIDEPIPSRIIWTKDLKENCLMGAEFVVHNRKIKKRIDKIVKNFKKMGGEERSFQKSKNRKMIEETLIMTPRGKIGALISRIN